MQSSLILTIAKAKEYVSVIRIAILNKEISAVTVGDLGHVINMFDALVKEYDQIETVEQEDCYCYDSQAGTLLPLRK